MLGLSQPSRGGESLKYSGTLVQVAIAIALYPLLGYMVGALVALMKPIAVGALGRAIVGILAAQPVTIGMIPLLRPETREHAFKTAIVSAVILGALGSAVLGEVFRRD